jgi:hypothetical protein
MKGEISEEALLKYSELAAEKLGVDFAEGEDMYDFARCMRPNGTYYGTRGKCRQGSEAGPAEKKEGTGARGAREGAAAAKAAGKKGGELLKDRAEGKKAALAASRTEGGKKISAKNARARLLKEELEKVKEKMRGASPDEQNRLLQEASKKAADRAAAGEGKKSDSVGRKVAAQTREANKQALAGAADAARRKTETEKRRGVDSEKTKKLGETQRQLFDAAKERKARAKEAERVAKELTKRAKADPGNKDLKQRALQANRDWNKAGTAADRAEAAWAKAHEKWSKQSERDKRARMSPEQRKEARGIDKLLKMLG